jgi:hypothetical protein
MIEVLLAVITLLLVALIIQGHRQHKELIEWLDAYAEMVGEAIDGMRNGKE